jgi:hypothetical protein
MDETDSGWLTAIALTIVGIAIGGSIAFVDGTLLASDLTGTPVVLLGGLVAVFATLAASDESPADE